MTSIKTSKEYRSDINMLRHDVITELIRKVGWASNDTFGFM